MRYSSSIFLLLIGFNFFLWQGIATVSGTPVSKIHFLDIGQGDATLIETISGTRVLIDGGPSKELLLELDQVIPSVDRYIDIVIMTHAQSDHFGGLVDLFDRYEVGLFIFNGESGIGDRWGELKDSLERNSIPVLVLKRGDQIKQGETSLLVISPDQDLIDRPDPNDGSLVVLLEEGGIKTILTGDIGFEAENSILSAFNLDIDILKVAHHGSRYSTGAEFIEETTPAIAVIEVGENRYGHPHPSTVGRLERAGTNIYRTDKNGRVSLLILDGKVVVDVER